jgi:transposase-like protein
LNPQQTFCPNPECPARGRVAKGNIVIHSQIEQRYRCKLCGKTFSAREGTVFFRARVDNDIITLVVTLIAFGCPIAAIEAAFGFQARTVRRWLQEAGQHCEAVHQEQVAQPQPLGQVQADEVRVKVQKEKGGRGGVLWMAMAMAVPTRLWLGGELSAKRDKSLICGVAARIRACALPGPLLLAVDGLPSYVDALHKAFRCPWRTGERKRPRLVPWPDVVIGRVIKQYGQGRSGRRCVVGVVHRLAQGSARQLVQLLRATQDKGQGRGTLNTAFIERLNATFRARLAPLARRTRNVVRRPELLRAGMYLVGTVYNLCSFHGSLTLVEGTPRTPAMAAGLTQHRWSVAELLWHRVPPPLWRPPKRRGRRSQAERELLERWAT